LAWLMSKRTQAGFGDERLAEAEAAALHRDAAPFISSLPNPVLRGGNRAIAMEMTQMVPSLACVVCARFGFARLQSDALVYRLRGISKLSGDAHSCATMATTA
jgi:hypothetical protein